MQVLVHTTYDDEQSRNNQRAFQVSTTCTAVVTAGREEGGRYIRMRTCLTSIDTTAAVAYSSIPVLLRGRDIVPGTVVTN